MVPRNPQTEEKAPTLFEYCFCVCSVIIFTAILAAFVSACIGVSHGSWVEYDNAACDEHKWHKGNCYVLSATMKNTERKNSEYTSWDVNHQVNLTLSAEDDGGAVLARAWRSPADSIVSNRYCGPCSLV